MSVVGTFLPFGTTWALLVCRYVPGGGLGFDFYLQTCLLLNFNIFYIVTQIFVNSIWIVYLGSSSSSFHVPTGAYGVWFHCWFLLFYLKYHSTNKYNFEFPVHHHVHVHPIKPRIPLEGSIVFRNRIDSSWLLLLIRINPIVSTSTTFVMNHTNSSWGIWMTFHI